MLKKKTKFRAHYKASLYLSVAAMLFMGACAEDGGKKQSKTNPKDTENVKTEKPKETNLLEIEGKVFSIPSPIQTAFLLKEAETTFQTDLLNPTANAGNYTTTHQKALALGVYGADLGYATIFDQTQSALSYMAISKRMSSELGISGVFDEDLLKRFEQNLGDQDSLLSLVSSAFKTTDRFLKTNEQHDVSVLVLAGGWVETLHFASSLAINPKNEAVKNRIGEQKITIKNLINILLPYNEHEAVANLSNQLNELKDLFAEIEFKYTYIPATTDEENKVTQINSKSEIVMTDEQLTAITDKVNAIRESIIN